MPNPCRHAGVCHSHLQHIQEMSYHVGPQFHGADESVVSVVGPIFNETVHHEPYYDSHDHSLKYTPDEHLMTNEVHHFHMTSDTPDHVYAVSCLPYSGTSYTPSPVYHLYSHFILFYLFIFFHNRGGRFRGGNDTLHYRSDFPAF